MKDGLVPADDTRRRPFHSAEELQQWMHEIATSGIQISLQEALRDITAEPGTWQEILSEDNEATWQVSQLIRYAEKIPDELLEVYLAGSRNRRLAIASRRKASANWLQVLARDKDPRVAEIVSTNPSAPTSALQYLLSHPSDRVRQKARTSLLNRNAPQKILAAIHTTIESTDDFRRLLSEPDLVIKSRKLFGASASTTTWQDILINFPDFKWEVLHARYLPVETLNSLAQDSTFFSRKEDPWFTVAYIVAKRPNLASETIELLTKEPSALPALAVNPDTPLKLLTELAHHRDPWIREHVAANPTTPINIMVILKEDADEWVRCAAQISLTHPSPSQR